MADYQVAVMNETEIPLADITVEAVSLNSWPTVSATGDTNRAGVVQFTALSGPHWFRPRVTRVSTTVGERVYTGAVKVQVISLGESMNVDYVMDTAGMGTHTTLASAMVDAIATNADKTIWLCKSVTESDIDIGGMDSGANITFASHSPHTVVITANANEDIFKQESNGGNGTGGLHFINLGFKIPTADRAIYNNNAGSEIKHLEFNQCNFDLSNLGYLARQDSNDSLGALTIEVRDCTGLLKGFYDVAGASATYAPDQLYVYGSTLTMTAFWDGGSENAGTNRTILNSSTLFVTNGITFSNGTTAQTFNNLYITFAAASALFTTAGASTQLEDLSFQSITIQFSNSSGTFCNLGAGSSNNNSGLFMDGIYGYMASGVGAGGTFITVDTDWTNLHVADIFGKDFTTQYSGPLSSGGFMGDTGVFLLLAGRAGGQLARGGTLASQRLQLRSTASGVAVGRIEFEDATFHVAFGSHYQLEVTNNAPGGYWRLGEGSGNLLDSSGNENTGSENGTITYGVTGSIADDSDTAITLDGSTEYV
ncbi:hypothetical protein LCGC14_1673050 [marine sediment metagenome]|uniref:Uncharacterized protein n=1 Tax=marine sediment metagenome TaxID=412755 RepID=A0A0F9K6J3_9ZZZZ